MGTDNDDMGEASGGHDETVAAVSTVGSSECTGPNAVNKMKLAKTDDGPEPEPLPPAPVVISRDYQLELFEMAKSKNVIVCLPTGSGKTWISLLLMKHYYQECVEKGKKIIFLANTVALVEQQHKYFQSHIPGGRVIHFVGYMNVDSWSSEFWQEKLSEADILVMSTQIFLDILNKEIRFRQVALLILDECHHTTKKHAMKRVMDIYNKCGADPTYEIPRVLGLTASVAKTAKDGEFGFFKQMQEMELALNARAVTSTQYTEVLQFSTNAKIRTAFFSGNMIDETLSALGALTEDISLFIVRPDEHPFILKILQEHGVHAHRRFIKQRSFIQELVNNIGDVQKLYETLGPWCANVAVRILTLEVYKIKASASLKPLAQTILAAYETWLVEMNVILTAAMKSGAELYSPKVKLLFAELAKKRTRDDLCAIVFVERRLDCQVLHSLAATFTLQQPDVWGFVKSHYVIGVNNGMTLEDVAASHSLQKKTIQAFRDRKYNVLFSTSVLEEGMDVRSCNLVIRFDKILGYRSFVQSTGRARSKDSEFVVFINAEEEAVQVGALHGYMNFAKSAVAGLIQNADCLEMDVGRDITPDELPPLCPEGKPDSPKLTSYDAIATVMMYCSTLTEYSRDMHGANFPVAWYDVINVPNELNVMGPPKVLYQGSLVLPRKAAVRGKVTGPTMGTKAAAKRGVFLEACRKLYDAGALDALLRPIRSTLNEAVLHQFIRPPAPDTGLPKKWYKSMVAHKLDCAAGLERTYTLYQLEISLVSREGRDKERMFDYTNRKYSTGLLCSESLDMIPPFKLECGLGTLTVQLNNMLPVLKPIRLGAGKRQALMQYQRNLFCDVLGLPVAKLLEQTSDAPLWVVPIRKENDTEYVVDYGVMAELEREYINGVLDPKYDEPVPEGERTLPEEKERFLEKGGYDDMVVIPWCFTRLATDKGSHLFCVLDVCKETEEADIDCFGVKPKANKSKSFKVYFEEKYKVKVTRRGQRLLECRQMGNMLDYLKPHARKGRDKVEVRYIPELVRTFSLPASIYTQAYLLPSILHRIQRFLVAMELGRSITSDLTRDLARPTYKVADPWAYNEIVGEPNVLWVDEPGRSRKDSGSEGYVPVPKFIYPRRSNGVMELTYQEMQRTGCKRRKLDALECMNSLSLALKLSNSGPDSKIMDTETYPPVYELLEAITLSGAWDRQSLERVEVLGDAFLKYSVTLVIFGIFSACDEGKLTQIRSKVVSNENLKWLGDEKGLGAMLAGGMFKPEFTFLPPSFVVNETLAKAAMKTGHNLDVFGALTATQVKVKSMTEEELMKFAKDGVRTDKAPKGALIGYAKLKEKSVADCMEAVIGSYYLAGGETSALHVMEWLGIRCPDTDGNLVVIGRQEELTSVDRDIKGARPQAFVPGISELETILKHKFQDPWLLVEAMTHPNDTGNLITDSFERLEFLGDAVLDFLITRHIYGKFLAKTEGQITDLRSALVNNVTFASLAVRNGFHKHLIQSSKAVENSIEHFAALQEASGHQVTGHFVMLTEYEAPTAQDVEVPKVLGDIFESLCGALFIDSGMNLEETWKAFYPLMKQEIELFSNNCPLAPIRKIMEMGYKTEMRMNERTSLMECSITTLIGRFTGVGNSKKSAKDAAAKLALRELGSSTPASS